MLFQGSMVALATPFNTDGSLDVPALARLIDHHVACGTQAIISVGTTGESPTVSVEEHIDIVRHTVSLARGRIAVIAGTGANSTSESIVLAKEAKSVGAQAGLSVVPYYNKPTQEGLYQHYKAQAEALDWPFILYNVPGRTITDLNDATALRLAQIPNIVGLKDATGNIARACYLAKHKPKAFGLYSGDDASAMAFMLCGGDGVISVTANVAPLAMRQLCDAARAGHVTDARAINDPLQALHHDLFVEPNPVPVKYALHRLGFMNDQLRLPLLPLSESHHAVLDAALKQAGLI
jgi:4-hydroxy-tetrahydrodipicolinate synthase